MLIMLKILSCNQILPISLRNLRDFKKCNVFPGVSMAASVEFYFSIVVFRCDILYLNKSSQHPQTLLGQSESALCDWRLVFGWNVAGFQLLKLRRT
jgi:hypothetical protein